MAPALRMTRCRQNPKLSVRTSISQCIVTYKENMIRQDVSLVSFHLQKKWLLLFDCWSDVSEVRTEGFGFCLQRVILSAGAMLIFSVYL
jgi:hypothetical protein